MNINNVKHGEVYKIWDHAFKVYIDTDINYVDFVDIKTNESWTVTQDVFNYAKRLYTLEDFTKDIEEL